MNRKRRVRAEEFGDDGKRHMPDASAEDELIASYRARFRCGPVGLWTTHLGAGADILYGCQFESCADSTGRAWSYDSGDEKESETEIPFTWKLVRDFTIDIQPVGKMECPEDWGVVHYGFRFASSRYGGDRMLVLYEVGRDQDMDPGFWWSPNPVVLVNDIPRS